MTHNASVVVKARALNGGVWSALNEASFIVDALQVPLRITEIMYNPIGGDIYEFLEIQNTGGGRVERRQLLSHGSDLPLPHQYDSPSGASDPFGIRQ